MTPAQQVAWDAMRSAYDEATVARMFVADDLVRLLALAIDQQEGQDCPYCGSNHSNGRDLSCTECGWYSVAARLVTRLAPLRSAAPVPASLPVCPECRGPMTPSHTCRAVPRSEHVCEGPRADCWCAGLPGAGAG